jgi:hypothetical protein
MSPPLLSFALYSPPQLAVIAAGCLLWVAVYLLVLVAIARRRFVELPALGVCGNLAWEFLWGVLRGDGLARDTGLLFALGYKTWFALDVVIFAALLRYGPRYVRGPRLAARFRPLCLVGVVTMFALFGAWAADGLDNTAGVWTAYVDNLVLSALYVFALIDPTDAPRRSTAIAWLKMLGTGLVSVGVCLRYRESRLLLVMCSLTLLLDLAYIAMLRAAKRAAGTMRSDGPAADADQPFVSR